MYHDIFYADLSLGQDQNYEVPYEIVFTMIGNDLKHLVFSISNQKCFLDLFVCLFLPSANLVELPINALLSGQMNLFVTLSFVTSPCH